MTRVSRRGLMKGGAGALAVVTLTPGSLRAAGFSTPALFVFDARFALSQTAASDHAMTGVPLLDPRVSDLGVAWRERIPHLLSRGGGLAGLTLWSDCLINQIFAREHGLSFAFSEVPRGEAAGALPLYHWRAR